METVRIRYTASNDNVRALVHALESIEGIESVEEVADLMPHMDDDDSSSAGLVSDGNDHGPDVHDIEVHAPNKEGVRSAFDRGVSGDGRRRRRRVPRRVVSLTSPCNARQPRDGRRRFIFSAKRQRSRQKSGAERPAQRASRIANRPARKPWQRR